MNLNSEPKEAGRKQYADVIKQKATGGRQKIAITDQPAVSKIVYFYGCGEDQFFTGIQLIQIIHEE